jgi:LacI family transcriptional regulator
MLTDIQNDRTRFMRYLEMLVDRRVDGLITLLLLDLDMLAVLEKHNIPSVTIGREPKPNGMNAVFVDNEAGARAGMEHLYALGHRRIVFIRGPKMLAESSKRWKGVRSFAHDVGLDLDPELSLELPGLYEPASAFDGGYKTTEELLRQKRSFTAIMAFDDLTALGAMRALAKGGLGVPEDCSVIGFDDISAAALCTPSLTTIRQPLETMGSIGVGILMDAISSSLRNMPFTPVHHKVSPILVVRESTRAINLS